MGESTLLLNKSRVKEFHHEWICMKTLSSGCNHEKNTKIYRNEYFRMFIDNNPESSSSHSKGKTITRGCHFWPNKILVEKYHTLDGICTFYRVFTKTRGISYTVYDNM